jgi:hypothetical protein
MSSPDDLDPFFDDPCDDLDPLPPPRFAPVWSDKLQPPAHGVRWLWDGYLAPANITLLTSQWKSGKTTLLSVLLARRAAGAETLAGRSLKPGRTAVICEEHEGHWQQRRRTLDFGGATAFFCRPTQGHKPDRREWLDLIESVARLGADGVDLVVIDPLASFLPGRGENMAELMLEALMPLERWQSAGMAILLLHHPRKGATLDGQAARGSGALSHHADILIEMRPYGRATDGDRRRILQSWSRFPGTPRQLVVEWTADGTDYRARGDVADEEFREHWSQLEPFFASTPGKLTRQEVRERWPTGRGSPSDMTLWRWLERAVAENLLLRDGTGHRGRPYRYWLPQRDAEWAADPVYALKKLDEQMRAELDRKLRETAAGLIT